VVVMKSIIFWDMTPCSLLSFNRRFGGRNRCHLLARWFAEPISSTLKMEAICSSETSIATQRTTRHHIPEDDTLHHTTYLIVIHILVFCEIWNCRFFCAMQGELQKDHPSSNSKSRSSYVLLLLLCIPDIVTI
jgi:hypothetical protein